VVTRPEPATAEAPAAEMAETAPAAETGDAALIAQLEWALRPAETEAIDPGEVQEEPVPARRRGRRRAMAVAAGLALGLAGSVSAFSLLRSRGDESAGQRRAGSSLTRLAASAVEPAWGSPAPRPPARAPAPAETAATTIVTTATTAAGVTGSEPVAAPTRAAHHDPGPVLPPPPEIRMEVAPPPRVDLASSVPAPAPSGPPVPGRVLGAPGTRRGDEVAGTRSRVRAARATPGV
jgi:hypothetical protein